MHDKDHEPAKETTDDDDEIKIATAAYIKAQRKADKAKRKEIEALRELDRIDPMVCCNYPNQPCPLHNLQCIAPKCLVRRSTLGEEINE